MKQTISITATILAVFALAGCGSDVVTVSSTPTSTQVRGSDVVTVSSTPTSTQVRGSDVVTVSSAPTTTQVREWATESPQFHVTQGSSDSERAIVATIMNPANDDGWANGSDPYTPTYVECETNTVPHTLDQGQFNCNIAYEGRPAESFWVSNSANGQYHSVRRIY